MWTSHLRWARKNAVRNSAKFCTNAWSSSPPREYDSGMFVPGGISAVSCNGGKGQMLIQHARGAGCGC